MGNSQATGTATRRLGPSSNGAGGRGLQELLVASAEGTDVGEQNVLTGLSVALHDWAARSGTGALEQDHPAGDMFNSFTGGMRQLDTMLPEVRLAIFKHLGAADLCRLGCTSKSVESWLRIQTTTWMQCLIACDDSASTSSSPNMLRSRHPQAYCFPLDRLGSLGVAAEPYAQAIAAYADVPNYGEKVAEAAVRALGKLGAAALPHVHRILKCATDKVYRDKMKFFIYLHGRPVAMRLWPVASGLESYAGALIDILPLLTSSQRLQEVVTHLEKGDRPDILLCVVAHAGEAALPYKLKTMTILTSYLNSLTLDTYYGDRRPGCFHMHSHNREYMKRILAALPRQSIHSTEVQEMMQRGLEARLEGMKAELTAKTRRMKAEQQDRVAVRLKAELEHTMKRMKAELQDRMGIMQGTKLEDKLKRMEAMLTEEIRKAEFKVRMEWLRAALLEAAVAVAVAAAAAVVAVRPSSANIYFEEVGALLMSWIEAKGHTIRFKKTEWPPDAEPDAGSAGLWDSCDLFDAQFQGRQQRHLMEGSR